MVVTIRLFLCAALLTLSSAVNTLQAQKSGPISVLSVYTTDSNFNEKSIFAPGKKINYHADISNNTGAELPVNIRITAFPNDYSPDPSLYRYENPVPVLGLKLPVGLTRFYNPADLPSNTKSYPYAVRIIVTHSDCQGVDCASDWSERQFTVQAPAPWASNPTGKAPNLIVYVHGCCTNEKNDHDVTATGNKFWQAYEQQGLLQSGQWEIVVWDWSDYTQKFPILDHQDVLRDARAAYENVLTFGLGHSLANAIANYNYNYVHLIGHSAGALLIQSAAEELAGIYKLYRERTFLHLTFLDAFTLSDSNTSTYGFLPYNHPHYSEHYVDIGLASTDAILEQAFNFDIAHWGWRPPYSDEGGWFGHSWPVSWYIKSITRSDPQFNGLVYGHPLSREGGNNDTARLSGTYSPGKKCSITTAVDICVPFSGLQYIASYGDLIRFFGANEFAGEVHYQLRGRIEGRNPDTFNEKHYLANYPDLQTAFGSNTRAATIHYITSGYHEGRTDKALSRRRAQR